MKAAKQGRLRLRLKLRQRLAFGNHYFSKGQGNRVKGASQRFVSPQGFMRPESVAKEGKTGSLEPPEP